LADVLVDTNVLIDVATEDARWLQWSSAQLANAMASGRVAVNPVIYAEFSVQYATIEEVEAALSGFDFQRLAIPYEAAFLAGKVFKSYRSRGGRRNAPLPDFFVGAHAAVEGLALLTRDAKRYREYFPKLKIIAPR
jgi:predicted nucleic acid-binding protein